MDTESNIEKISLEVALESRRNCKRTIATEVPLALSYNGVAHVVMMVTPDDLENFIIGFSITEGIITTPSDIQETSIVHNDNGIVANIWIKKELGKKLLSRHRNLVGQTGCGLCGVEALEDAVRHYVPVGSPTHFSYDQIHQALKDLEQMQPLNQLTGAVHGAAFINASGNITNVMEDVGRHNAFDKLIGELFSSDCEIEKGAVILTSRCSFELVQKALAIKLPLLITISAPTSLAIELAEKHSLTLIALARHDSIQVMNDPFELF